MSPLRAELGLRWRPLTQGQTECGCLVGGSGKAPLAEGGHAAGSAHGEIRRVVDEPSDLDQVEEDGRVDGPRPRGVVVRIRDDLENLGGQVEPLALKGRDVPPMPVPLVSVADTRERSQGMGKRVCNGRGGSWASRFKVNRTNGKSMRWLGCGKEAHLFLQIARTLCADGVCGATLDSAGFLVVAGAVGVSCNGASDNGGAGAGAGGEGEGGRPWVCPPRAPDPFFVFFLRGIFRRQRGGSLPRDVRNCNWQLTIRKLAAQRAAIGGGGVDFWMP